MALAALRIPPVPVWSMVNVQSTTQKIFVTTTMLQNGHVRYARPNNGRTTHKNGIDVDNRSVVPHNVDLSNIKPTSMWKESIATAWKNTCLSIFARDLTVQRLGYSIGKQPLNLQRKLLMRYVIT